MQRSLRMNELQLFALSEKALNDNGLKGYLFKRSSDSGKWQCRYFVLFQNLLFYYESDSTTRPSGVIFLEGSYCEKVVQQSGGRGNSSHHSFRLTYRKEGSKHYVIGAETEPECNAWMHALEQGSYSKMLLQKEELEQKHLHLVQIVESEKTAKWQYTQQCEELTVEIKKLRAELRCLKKDWRLTPQESPSLCDKEPDEIRKIKKVQSFFRGWLCRRRWKQIVSEYINSPHAENMRKRNSLVFRMVEAEEEYMEQLQLLISCFLRPLKMAASSQKPPCTHDEVNSIFLNSETIMFLHQIFLKGLTARMESWPTLVLGIGDLFDMLLPMLVIYQEYVRNHHFSLQVLAECKQKEVFSKMLKRLEEKPALQGRTLETFLTYPMHQVPRYIITLHELLAHTPHNHVERRALNNAKAKLEELSKQMHDEVSETENIRKNLAIERIIIGGCDILLDVNQVFVRQGNVLQVFTGKELRAQRGFRGSFRGSDKEVPRQCFLFSNHILLCTRATNGKLQLVDVSGQIPLSEATLIEDPNEQFQFYVEDEGSVSSSHATHTSESVSIPGGSFSSSSGGGGGAGKDYGGLDFKIIWEAKSGNARTIHLVAPTMQEKAAWILDVSQCIDNVHFNDLFHGAMNDSSSVTMPHSVRNDPRLFKDDVDIRFSRTLNSCKLPQIRYASPERLFERLTDLRFLSIDFLNTFLLTYRVFTDGVTVLEALKKVHYNPDTQLSNWSPTNDASEAEKHHLMPQDQVNLDYDYTRRISTSSMASDVSGPQHRQSVISTSSDSQVHVLHQLQQQQGNQRNNQHWRLSHRKFEEEQARERFLRKIAAKTAEQIPLAEEPVLVAPSAALLSASAIAAEVVIEEDTSSPLTYTHQLDSLIADEEALASLLSPGDQMKPLPGPPPPSPEVPARTMPSLSAGGTAVPAARSFDTEASEKDGSMRETDSGSTLAVPHSHSSETLRADHSSASSPNLSSAESSATLVGSIPSVDEDRGAGQEDGENDDDDGGDRIRVAGELGTKTATGASGEEDSPSSRDESGEATGEDEDPDIGNTTPPSSAADSLHEPRHRSASAATVSSLTSAVSVTATRANSNNNNNSKNVLNAMGGSNCPSATCLTPSATASSSRSSSRMSVSRMSNTSSNASSQAQQMFTTLSNTMSYLRVRGSGGKRVSSGTGDSTSGSDSVTLTASSSVSNSTTPRSSFQTDITGLSTPRSSFQFADAQQMSSKAGVVVTSSRASSRRSSTASAASAFAAATAACSNPPDMPSGAIAPSACFASQPQSRLNSRLPSDAGPESVRIAPQMRKRESMISTAATMRVLNVLRHWVSKHSQDFESDPKLMQITTEFLEELVHNTTLLPAEHKAASQLLSMITKEETSKKIDLELLLAHPVKASKETIESLSALEIAEGMTFLDHKIFVSIMCSEFLGQAWMKNEKVTKAYHILLMTKRFNEMSRVVASEILRQTEISKRVSIIEKWAAVADICRCLHNFNGVLQICAAFTNSSVFRLKKTWEKVCKTSRQTIDKLQTLVSTDGRFRNMREALHRCDPPCIPYLGMYLTDLSFIEEGTPNFTEDGGLLNFSKMRMIAHVIREIKHFQQTPYKIEASPKVLNYLLDMSRHFSDDELYQKSLCLEPRLSRLGTKSTPDRTSSFSTSPSHASTSTSPFT